MKTPTVSRMTRCITLLAVLCVGILLLSCCCESRCLSKQEEGTSRLFYYTFAEQSVVPPIVWKMVISGKVINVASCDLREECINYFPSEFNATIQPYTTDGGTSNLKAYLEVISLNRTMTHIEVLDSFGHKDSCDLYVFVGPTKLTCSGPKIENDVIKVSCASAEALHNPVCLFEYLPENLLQYNITYDEALRTCTVYSRPTSFTPRAEYSFRLKMYSDKTGGPDHNVSTSSWTPPLSVLMVDFMANNQRTSLEVTEERDVRLLCTLDSDIPYILELLRADTVIAIGPFQNYVAHVIEADSILSGTEYSCRVRNYTFLDEFGDVGILGSRIKISTEIHTRGTPTPMTNSRHTSWRVDTTQWALPLAYIVLSGVMISLPILIWRLSMHRRQQRASRQHPSVLSSLTHSSDKSGAHGVQPVIAGAQGGQTCVMGVPTRSSSSDGPTVHYTNASGGGIMCDPPRHEELPALAGNLGGTHDSTDTTSGRDTHQIAIPPPNDTVLSTL